MGDLMREELESKEELKKKIIEYLKNSEEFIVCFGDITEDALSSVAMHGTLDRLAVMAACVVYDLLIYALNNMDKEDVDKKVDGYLDYIIDFVKKRMEEGPDDIEEIPILNSEEKKH